MDVMTLLTYSSITVLVCFMGFIVWNLAKESEAGVFGTWILFIVLGLGVLGFLIKAVIGYMIENTMF